MRDQFPVGSAPPARPLPTDPSSWPARAAGRQSDAGPTARAAAMEPLSLGISRIERAIDLRKLRYFVHIVAEGSFSIAAKRVHVAQPALSHHVQELEAALGVPLLTRSAHGVFPTEAGRCLYEHGMTILGQVREAAAEVSAFNQDRDSGNVSVGLHGAAASLLTPPLVEAVRTSAPELQLAIEEGSDLDMLRWTQARRLDIALLYDGVGDDTFAQQPILTEVLSLVGPAGADGGESCDISLAEALRRPLILPRRPNLVRERVERAAAAAGIPLDVVIEVDGIASIKRLVASGFGYSVLSAAEVFDECRLGVLRQRQIAGPHLEQTLFLCQLRSGQPTRAAAKMRRLVLEVVDDMVSRALWPGIHSPTPALALGA